jgi:filamentous hemagglutinin family protein
MNHVYRLVWSQRHRTWVAVSEIARGRKKGGGGKLAAATLCLATVVAQAAPSGGQVVAGSGQISSSGNTTTVTQSSQNLSLNWRSFNIAPQETVNFLQPSASSVAVNHIFDTNGTQILGHLNANGQVYLINPNGILFGRGSVVNVGGLVASTLNPTDANQSGTTRSFSGSGTGSVTNEGTITAAPGGYVVLMGNHISNTGTIVAEMGTVGLGAGSAVTLTFASDNLVGVQVDRSTLNNVAANGGLIQADGGKVIMTAGARDALLASAVNNTGVVEARTVEDHDGTITLLAGMSAGQVNVGGTLDASASNGGNGGAIETSAAHVSVANNARVTTQAPQGLVGSWLVDPQDFTVAASGGDITGASLSSNLANTSVVIQSSSGSTAGSGNVNVNDAVSWSADHTLTLTASNNVNVNANITATGAAAGLALNPNTANGSESASGSGVVNLKDGVSITLSGANPSLSIGGQGYTVINSLGAQGSTTGTDLQGINGNLSGFYALGSNIDASPTSSWNGGQGFTPIGSFGGVFNGLGHTISGLVINLPSTDSVGLFGTSSGSIANVGLVGGSVTGGQYSGGLVGKNWGTVTDSYVTGSVSGTVFVGGLVGENSVLGATSGTVANSYSTANVNGSIVVGGLVGGNYGTVQGSYATGTVTGTADRVGGLVGANDFGVSGVGATITDSYATGNVNGVNAAGGLVGSNYGTVNNTHASGSVTATGSADGTGGLIGKNNAGIVNNSYATGAVTGVTYVGGLVGLNAAQTSSPPVIPPTITNSYATGAVTGSTSVGGLVGCNCGYGATAAISNSYATGSVTGTTVTATGASDVGGLVGLNFAGYGGAATITNSYAAGAVGAETGSNGVGGLIGTNQFLNNGSQFGTTTVTHSFWDMTATGQNASASGLGQGLTTAQMQQQNSFTGWDFTSTGSWAIYEGYTDPLLRSFLTPLTVTANDASQVYNATGYSGGNGVTYSLTTGSHLLGSVGYGGSSQGALNVGTYGITPLGLFSDQQGYLISYASGTLTITPAPLTVTGTTVTTTTYDGTTTATLTGGMLSGVQGSDALTLTQSGTFASANVGNCIAVTASDSFSGTAAGNYTFTQPTGLTGNITPATLTVTGTTVSNKVYDGTTAATLAGGTLFGIIGSDVVTLTQAGAFASKNAGTGIAVTASDTLGGAGSGNYTLAQPTGLTANITPATLTVTGTSVANKVYDGTTAATLSAGTLSGLIGSDSVTLAQAGTFTSPNAGTGVAVTASDSLSGAAAGNYMLTQPTGLTANITPATLIYIASPNSGTSGNVPTGLNGTITGFVSGDTLANATTGTLAWTTNATASSPAGSYDIDGSGLSATNYMFVQAAGNATALTLTAAGSGGGGTTPPPTPPATPSTPSIAAIAGLESNILPPPDATSQTVDLDGKGHLIIENGGVKLPSDAIGTH